MSVTTPTQADQAEIRLSDLMTYPHELVAKAILASIAYFPSGYEYNTIAGTIQIKDHALANEWLRYVKSNEYDTIAKRLLKLLDTVAANERQKVCGARRYQDLPNAVLQRHGSSALKVIKRALESDVKVDEAGRCINIVLGAPPHIRYRLAPTFMSAIVFIEGARTYPAKQLVVVGKHASEGFERRVFVSCEAYALTVIGLSKAFISSTWNEYYFLFPLVPSKGLAVRLDHVVARLREKRIDFNALPEPVTVLLLTLAIGVPEGAVELIGLRAGGKKGDAFLDIVVELEEARLFLDVVSVEPEFADAVINAAARIPRDIESRREKESREASHALRAMVKLYEAAWGIGDFTENLYEALREAMVLKMSEIREYAAFARRLSHVVQELVSIGRVMV